MPSWLLWLGPVIVATPAAVAWTAWSGRTRSPVGPEESMAAYARFRQALAAPAEAEEPGDR